MADTTAAKSTESVESAPAKRGRPRVERDPNGKQLSAFFDSAELAHIEEASFVKRHRKDSDLIRAAVLAYIQDVPAPKA